jgi:hypothetical protein
VLYYGPQGSYAQQQVAVFVACLHLMHRQYHTMSGMPSTPLPSGSHVHPLGRKTTYTSSLRALMQLHMDIPLRTPAGGGAGQAITAVKMQDLTFWANRVLPTNLDALFLLRTLGNGSRLGYPPPPDVGLAPTGPPPPPPAAPAGDGVRTVSAGVDGDGDRASVQNAISTGMFVNVTT